MGPSGSWVTSASQSEHLTCYWWRYTLKTRRRKTCAEEVLQVAAGFRAGGRRGRAASTLSALLPPSLTEHASYTRCATRLTPLLANDKRLFCDCSTFRKQAGSLLNLQAEQVKPGGQRTMCVRTSLQYCTSISYTEPPGVCACVHTHICTCMYGNIYIIISYLHFIKTR